MVIILFYYPNWVNVHIMLTDWYFQTTVSAWDYNALRCGNDYTFGKIIGGNKSSNEMIPWVSYLIVNDEYRCTAVLITWAWAITAAHCV